MLLFEDHLFDATLVEHRAVISSIAFSSDGTMLATGAKDGSMLLRDANGSVSHLLERGSNSLPVYTIGYFPNESGVIVGGEFGWMCYRQEAGLWKQSGPVAFQPVTSLAVLDERTVVIGFGDRVKASAGTLEIWNIADDRKLRPYFHEPNGVRAVAACPKKKLVAWATGHRKVCVWDITTPKPVSLPQASDCAAIALSADGRALAVAGDWIAKIYDLQTKRERAVLKGHKGHVAAVAFSPDGSTVATGSWDQTVRLWDAETGQERVNYKWDIGRVYCLTYAPDGFRLAAGGDMGRVVVWDAE